MMITFGRLRFELLHSPFLLLSCAFDANTLEHVWFVSHNLEDHLLSLCLHLKTVSYADQSACLKLIFTLENDSSPSTSLFFFMNSDSLMALGSSSQVVHLSLHPQEYTFFM